MNFLIRTAGAIAASALAFSALAADMTGADVRKVDKENKKLTLRHEHIKNLDMPPMTMVFGVKDAKLLDKVKAGDKVRFAAVDEGGGKLVVTEIEVQK
jgi:Cu(I)/Ag(I) efflux system periplasmic protein CusF